MSLNINFNIPKPKLLMMLNNILNSWQNKYHGYLTDEYGIDLSDVQIIDLSKEQDLLILQASIKGSSNKMGESLPIHGDFKFIIGLSPMELTTSDGYQLFHKIEIEDNPVASIGLLGMEIPLGGLVESLVNRRTDDLLKRLNDVFDGVKPTITQFNQFINSWLGSFGMIHDQWISPIPNIQICRIVGFEIEETFMLELEVVGKPYAKVSAYDDKLDYHGIFSLNPRTHALPDVESFTELKVEYNFEALRKLIHGMIDGMAIPHLGKLKISSTKVERIASEIRISLVVVEPISSTYIIIGKPDISSDRQVVFLNNIKIDSDSGSIFTKALNKLLLGFFKSQIEEWNKLDVQILKRTLYTSFEKMSQMAKRDFGLQMTFADIELRYQDIMLTSESLNLKATLNTTNQTAITIQ